MSTFTSIRTSEANKTIVTDLTRKLALGPENVIARIAFAYSLSKNVKFTPSQVKDSKGKEYSKNTLFGNNIQFYVALICAHYQVYKSDKDIPKYIKMHIDHGLELIDGEIKKSPTLDGFDFISSKIESGLKMLQVS
jgi:DNA sulfur modification protein DndE